MKSKFLVILTLIFALCFSAAYADGVNVDSGINFVSDTGEIIRTFPDVTNSDYTMYATVNVKNETNLQKDMILFVSIYDGNNNFKKLLYDTISAPANGEDMGEVPVIIPQGTQENDFICKAYLWDTVAGKKAYRTDSIFLDFNTNLYGITIDGDDIADYSDDTDFYSIKVAKANSKIKVYPKSGATSVQYNEINVPGTSKIQLSDGANTRNITIKTYLEEKDKYTLSALKYKIGNTEYLVEGFDPDIQEYTVNLPDNTFYVALLPESIGEVTCTIQDINDSPNVINGVSFGKMRTDTTGPAYVYERKAVKGIVPIKNENTKAFVNVTDGENSCEYIINFHAVQPRLTEFNLVGTGGSYVPVFTSGAGFNNDNGTICAADRIWAAANISKKLMGASYFMSPYNNKGSGQWWNDVGKKGDEYFNFTADTAGTVYLLASSNLSDYSGWEKVNNGIVPTHPKDYTLGDKTWNDYDDTDYFMSCVKWNSDRGRCDECGVKPMKDSQVSYIDGCVAYKYAFAKHFEAGEQVSIKHTGSYGNSAAEVIWAVVWDVDVNYPDVPDEPEDDETGDIEIDENLPEGIKNIASYALDGFLFNQLSNNWAEVTLEGSTDEATGVITTTATYEGTLAAGKRIATFQPWGDGQNIGANAAGSYTMHFGFTVNEITSPVYLEYNYSRDGGYKKTLISLSDNKVVAGNDINGSKFISVQAPYTVNIFMNTKTCEGYIYVNDQLLHQGNMRNSGADIKWREARVFSLKESTDIKFVTTAVNSSVYDDGITIQDVISAYLGVEGPGDDESGDDETDENIPEGVKNISAYALAGYNYKQINNFWAEIKLSDATDANGVITTTASNTGALAAEKRIATFQPWEEKGIGANAAGDYIMHFGFTVNEITSPVYLEYNYNRDGGSRKILLSLSDSKVVAGNSMSGETFIEVHAPYTIDIFMNIATCEGYIYVNNQLLYQGNMRNSVADIKWREVRVFSLGESTDIEFVTTAANSSVYNESITIQEVINAYMSADEPGEDPVDPPVTPDQPGDDEEDYTLDGYNNKQLDNNWANVNLENVQDSTTGVHTTTASYSGTLASGSRIATFQPWEKGQGTRENAAGTYTMHFGFTVNEVTAPLALTYKYDGGGTKYLAVLTDSKVVAGSNINGEKYIEVTAPYTINCFMNIQSGDGYVYVNDQLLYQGGMTNSSGDKKWHEVRITSLAETNSIKFVTTKANSSIFNESVSIQEVIDYIINGVQFGDDDESGDNETDENIPEGINNISSYALDGYFYKQLNNNWAEITLSDATDANGVITTTATREGTLAAGKRIASFQPWDKNKPTYSKAPGAYTMHFGFTVKELNAPLCLEYRFDASKKLISFSNSKVVWGDSMNGDTYIEVTEPYTIDIFMNIQDCRGIIYVNDQVLYDGTIEGASRFCNSGADTKWTEVRVKNLHEATDIKFVTTAANCSIYNEGITLQDVITAYMGEDQSGGDGETGEDPVDPPVTPDQPDDDEVVKAGPVLDLDIANNAGDGTFNADATSWTDLSENGYDVTLTDVSVWSDDALCITNGSRNEANAVLLSDNISAIINSYNFTIEFDINSIDEGSAVSASKNEEFSICEENGKLAFYFAGIVRNTISVSLEDVISGYNQITVSYDTNNNVAIKWYINGELKAEKSVVLPNLKTIDSLMLGSYDRHYSGNVSIKKFKIFDYTKTAEDVAE